MGNKLFPKEIIEHSSEANFSKHSLQTKLIYITVLVALVACIVALPLIDVTVSVRSQGIIQPVTNRNQLVSLVSGKIEELYIDENSTVVRGQIVAEISAPVLQEQAQYNRQRQQEVSQYLADLAVLLNIDGSRFLNSLNKNDIKAPPLLPFRQQVRQTVEETRQARQQVRQQLAISDASDEVAALQEARSTLWTQLTINITSLTNTANAGVHQVLLQFKQQISGYLQQIEKNRTTLTRHKLLHKKGIISDATYQQSQTDLRTAWDQLLSLLQANNYALLNALQIDSGSSATSGPASPIHLQTAKYISSLLKFKQQARTAIQKINLTQQKFERNKKLYRQNIISEAAYEKSRFALQSAQGEFQLVFEQQQNKWQADRVSYQNEMEKLVTELQQIQEKKNKYIIRAPISGSIQSMKGLYEGSLVSPNQPLAQISPDTALIAECYVPPKDIGLLREGMDVRFQISAFDYNQWGLLTGTVTEISNDVTVINKRPVFKVRCALDQTYLTLRNGYRGNLKKGMTLQARFKVAQRSLFQLLYDNLDDWLNPNWDQQETQTQKAAM